MKTITTRELVYAIRRALRLGYSTQNQRRYRNDLRVQPNTKTGAMRVLEFQKVIPRGYKAKAEAWCQKLIPQYHQDTESSLTKRLDAYKVAQFTREIRARGGETVIHGKFGNATLEIRDRQDGLFLLKAEGWRHYSARFGARPASLAYLCGKDDNGRWAVRVYGTCNSVQDALYVIEPKAVQKARDWGKTVLRQGDVYAVETLPAYDGKGSAELPFNHRWDPETRTLRHLDSRATHTALTIPFPVRFYTQTALRMGRLNAGSRTGRGD